MTLPWGWRGGLRAKLDLHVYIPLIGSSLRFRLGLPSRLWAKYLLSDKSIGLRRVQCLRQSTQGTSARCFLRSSLRTATTTGFILPNTTAAPPIPQTSNFCLQTDPTMSENIDEKDTVREPPTAQSASIEEELQEPMKRLRISPVSGWTG